MGPLLLRGTSAAKIPPDFYPPHVGVGPAGSTSPPLLPALMWLLLYTLSYRASLQLDFRGFSRMVVL